MVENTFQCVWCLDDKFIWEKKTKFFCECNYAVCEWCFDYFYINNNYKCMICKNTDLKQFYDELYDEFKRFYKIFDTLKKHSLCDCK
jgi:hypothetical protein